MAIILSTIILAGCSNSSHLSVSQTHSSPSATAQPRPTAEPLAVSVSPERSCYQQLYDQPDNPNWALYAEITITNYTDQPLTIETIFLYPNHQFYGEDASTPVLLPEDAIVALRETGLWELHTTKNHNHTPFACHCDKVGGPLFFCFIHIILSVVHRAWWSSGGRAAYSWGSCW